MSAFRSLDNYMKLQILDRLQSPFLMTMNVWRARGEEKIVATSPALHLSNESMKQCYSWAEVPIQTFCTGVVLIQATAKVGGGGGPTAVLPSGHDPLLGSSCICCSAITITLNPGIADKDRSRNVGVSL